MDLVDGMITNVFPIYHLCARVQYYSIQDSFLLVDMEKEAIPAQQKSLTQGKGIVAKLVTYQ